MALNASIRAKGLAPTVINVAELTLLLTRSGYDPLATLTLTQGLTAGFKLGLQGPTPFRVANLPSAANPDSRARIAAHIAAECSAGRMIGPFPTPPSGVHWANACVSPLGEIAKKESGKFRLIFNLSHTAAPSHVSVNSLIGKE